MRIILSCRFVIVLVILLFLEGKACIAQYMPEKLFFSLILEDSCFDTVIPHDSLNIYLKDSCLRVNYKTLHSSFQKVTFWEVIPFKEHGDVKDCEVFLMENFHLIGFSGQRSVWCFDSLSRNIYRITGFGHSDFDLFFKNYCASRNIKPKRRLIKKEYTVEGLNLLCLFDGLKRKNHNAKFFFTKFPCLCNCYYPGFRTHYLFPRRIIFLSRSLWKKWGSRLIIPPDEF